MKYLPLFHHFKAIYQFPKHIIFWVKIVANAALINYVITTLDNPMHTESTLMKTPAYY